MLAQIGCLPASVFVLTFTGLADCLLVSVSWHVSLPLLVPAHAIIACAAFTSPECESVVLRSRRQLMY